MQRILICCVSTFRKYNIDFLFVYLLNLFNATEKM